MLLSYLKNLFICYLGIYLFIDISDIETLNRHQFEILEQCLYYYLAAEAQRKAQYFNAIQALAAFPPESTDLKGSRVRVFFHQITLQNFIMVSNHIFRRVEKKKN